MKVAIVGSRGLSVEDFTPYLPADVSEIVSGGAGGIDRCAAEYARSRGLVITEFLPDYRRYKKGAPLKRNLQIIEYADCVIAFWDNKSRGTKFVIDYCRAHNKNISVYILNTK